MCPLVGQSTIPVCIKPPMFYDMPQNINSRHDKTTLFIAYLHLLHCAAISMLRRKGYYGVIFTPLILSRWSKAVDNQFLDASI